MMAHIPTSRTTVDVGNIHTTKKPLPDGESDIVSIDPLYCCNISGFLTQEIRLKNGFKPYWDREKRLVFETENPRVLVNKDVSVVPLSCEKETCIFRKLNIVSDTGSVDMEAFYKLLDNFTAPHPTWNKVKAMLIKQCITWPHGYTAGCEINKILGCTLDLLSENCPNASEHDVCRNSQRNNTICQISSSILRAKSRRTICELPSLVSSEVLTACGVTSISRTEFVTDPPVKWNNLNACKDDSAITNVLMTDMSVLNEHNFMDYFKMREKIIVFTLSHQEWAPYKQFYLNTYIETPRYNQYCTEPKKLMNILDAMLTTCPISRRNNTEECKDLFKVIVQDEIKEKEYQIHKYFNHVVPTMQPIKYGNGTPHKIKEWNMWG